MTRGVQISQLPGPDAGQFPALPGSVDSSFGGFDAGPAAGRAQHTDIFRAVHRRLRGRYLLAIVLGLVCAVAGGAAGYYTQKPIYKCETMIRVVMMDIILVRQDQEYQNRINQFNNIVSTQASFIQSSRVLSRAMDAPAWLELGRPRTPEVERQFRDSLRINPQRDSSELISVSFEDEDPRAAKAGLEGVISAYDDIHVKAENAGVDRTRLNTLEKLQREYTSRIANLEADIAEATKDYGTSDMTLYQTNKLNQLFEIEDQIALLELKLANAGVPVQSGGGADGAAVPPPKTDEPAKKLTAYEIVVHGQDPEIMELVSKRREADALLDRVRAGGATEENREVKRLKTSIEVLDKKIQDAVERWNKSGGTGGDLTVLGATRPETPNQMVERLNRLQAQREKWNTEAKGFKGVNELVSKKRKEIEPIRVDLNDVNDALSGIRTKMSVRQDQPLIQIDRDVAMPRAPAFDRRKKVGAIGFLLGGLLPFGLIMLYGLVDRRFRYSDQAGDDSAGLPLLGILPELPTDLSDPEEAAAAAHCVHQMRTMLQISGGSRKVYAITSATSGDGKTCLTLSLGLSFAASGSKTLLVDFDLVGQGLSSKLKIRPEHGMASSLETGQPGESIVATKIERLFLLPAGRKDEEFVPRLSRAMVQQAIDAVRSEYDVVIIDTGPVLGSLEANFVTSQAEGVVLVVGRNQHRSLVQRAEQHLISLGARVIGQVFNRALSTDFRSSLSSGSIRSMRSTSGQPVTAIQVARVDDGLLELDPVSRTVAMDVRR